MKHHLPEKSTTAVEVWMVLDGIFCSVDWEKSKGETDNTMEFLPALQEKGVPL